MLSVMYRELTTPPPHLTSPSDPSALYALHIYELARWSVSAPETAATCELSPGELLVFEPVHH